MTVLTIVTVCWAAVLVLAVAASLLAILVFLVRIARVIGGAREALATVRDRAVLLRDLLRPLSHLGGTVQLPRDRPAPSGIM
jgi:hypothetical protein